MKLTCLGRGQGFHSPPCHIIDIGGFRILLECPLNLSSLTAFAPISNEEGGGKEASLSADALINSSPWYKMVGSLSMWDASLINIILISSPMGIMGLPFLTRNSNFSAKIYATEAATKIGQLMMEELVAMHEETLQFYGPVEESMYPEFMGKMADELGSCSSLYSKSEINECIKKIQAVKYAEECCYDGALILKAFSSGLEVGGANWTLRSPGRSVTYLTSSITISATAMEFKYHDLHGNDFILFSDFSSLNDAVVGTDVQEVIREDDKHDDDDDDDDYNEMDKIDFICSCVVDAARGGGCVLIPIGRFGIVLQLLEAISQVLEASELKVPLYMISSAAEEMLALANVSPEWVSRERQRKLYSGSSLFGHAELIKNNKLRVFPHIHSPDLIQAWEEPCIVFSPHWTLRLGPAVHLLRRWHADDRSLLVLESDVDANLALLPFMPTAMKVLRCSFLSGLPIKKVRPLLEFLKPKHILFPEDLRSIVPLGEAMLASILYYSEYRTLIAPSTSDGVEADLSIDLARQLRPKRMPQENLAISRLHAKLLLLNGKHLLIPQKIPPDLSVKRLLWGTVDRSLLLRSLADMGIESSLEEDEDGGRSRILVQEPRRAAIDLEVAAPPVIAVDDERLAALINDAVRSSSDGI